MDNLSKFIDFQTKASAWQFTKIWHLPMFDDPHKEAEILGEMPNIEKFKVAKKVTQQLGTTAAKEIVFLYKTPILSKPQEQHLFRKYNYCKYKFKQLIERKSAIHIINRLEKYYNTMKDVKNILVSSNSRVVMNLAKKHGFNLDDAVSDGCAGLVQAVDYFDFRRKIKFITYAYTTVRERIKKGKMAEFARYSSMTTLSVLTAQDGDEFDVVNPNVSTFDDVTDSERNQSLYKKLAMIPKKEREVLNYYYGLGNFPRLNLYQIGSKLNRSHERIRQLRVQGEQRIKKLAL